MTEADPSATVLSVDGISAFDSISREAMLQGLCRAEGGESASLFVRVSRRSTCGSERVARCTTSTKVKAADRETHLCHSSSLLDSTQLWKQCQPKCQTFAFMNDVYMSTRPLVWGTRHWRSSSSGMQGSTSMKARPKFGTGGLPSVHKRAISSNGWPGRPMQEPQCGEGLRCHHTQDLQCAGSSVCLVALVALRGSEGHIFDQSFPTSVVSCVCHSTRSGSVALHVSVARRGSGSS